MSDKEDDLELATGEDFKRADEDAEALAAARRIVEDIDVINREYMEQKAKRRILFGERMGKLCKKYPKSAWWIVGFAAIGLGSGSFFTWFGFGIVILVIAHMIEG